MGATSVALRSLTSRSGLRRTLVAYALFGLVEIAIWLAINLYAFDKGGAPLAGVVGVLQLLPAVVLAPPLPASATECHEALRWHWPTGASQQPRF